MKSNERSNRVLCRFYPNFIYLSHMLRAIYFHIFSIFTSTHMHLHKNRFIISYLIVAEGQHLKYRTRIFKQVSSMMLGGNVFIQSQKICGIFIIFLSLSTPLQYKWNPWRHIQVLSVLYIITTFHCYQVPTVFLFSLLNFTFRIISCSSFAPCSY